MPASAQQAGEIYTWTHAYGATAGANVEGWEFDFGGTGQSVTLDNLIDGELTVTETNQQNWAIRDNFNAIRESSFPGDFGGLDLTGLSAIEIDIEHNGLATYGGEIFAHTPLAGSGCCDFDVLGSFNVAPGPQTISVPLTGLTADKQAWVRTLGIHVYEHTWDGGGGPLTWKISDVRSVGPELSERYLSPHETPGDLDGVVVKFDGAAMTGSPADDTQPAGLTIVPNDIGGQALRWVDLGGGPGLALAWGNGRDGLLAVDYHTRPTDLRNYRFVEVRMRAQPGAGADSEVGVQFYTQSAVPGDEFIYQSAGDLLLPADSAYHILKFPIRFLDGLGQVQWHGVNLASHAGNMDIRVDYIRFAVPEPSSIAMMLAGCVAVVGLARKRRG
jgi:hypothetical protein